MLNTGNSHGASAAALGLIFRALGRGFKVCLIHFDPNDESDLAAAKQFEGRLEVHMPCRQAASEQDSDQARTECGREAWQLARNIIASGDFQLVVLDQFSRVIEDHMVPEPEIIECLVNRPDPLHLMVTGAELPDAMAEKADLVTCVTELKHP